MENAVAENPFLLYLFEVLIDDIFFQETVFDVPTKKQITVSVKLGSIVSLEIRSETLPTQGENANKRYIDYKSGKSYLCFMAPPNLLKLLEDERVEISVWKRNDVKPIGSSKIPWDETFRVMIRSSIDENAENFMIPTSIVDNLALFDNEIVTVNVNVYMRLTCLGKNFQTNFEILQKDGATQFLFKSHDMATTFMCTKYRTGTSLEFLPMGAVYNFGNIRMDITEKRLTGIDGNQPLFSWLQSNSDNTTRASICLFPEYINLKMPEQDSVNTFDIVSLRGRPEEERFLDFLTGKKIDDVELDSIQVSVATRRSEEDGTEKFIFISDDWFKPQEGSQDARVQTKACQCPETLTTCRHVLRAIELYEKSHPDLMINGRRVDYDKLRPPKPPEDQKDAKKDKKRGSKKTLRLRGGDDEESEEDEPESDVEEPEGTDEQVEEDPGWEELQQQPEDGEDEESPLENELEEPEGDEDENPEEMVLEEPKTEDIKEDVEEEVKEDVEGVPRSDVPPEEIKLDKSREDVPSTVLKKPKGCLNPTCRMAWKLRSVGLSQIARTSESGENAEREKSDYFCADFFCPESTRRNTSLQVKLSDDENFKFEFKCDDDRYCPAAKKFKELGLGPLATERCQGTIKEPIDSPVQYGISQTYGTFDTYGAFGIFSKTNKTELPEDAGSLPREILRLRGGGDGIVETEEPEDAPMRLRGAGESKSPLIECREVMDQFDKILEEYRAALDSCKQYTNYDEYMMPSRDTPNCGHPRCTYISELPLPPIHWDCPNPLPVGICENPHCPYLPQDLKRIYQILEEKRAGDVRRNQQNFPYRNPPKIVNTMMIDNIYCPNPTCTMRTMESCSNPECPYSQLIPSSDGMSAVCSNPQCPFTKEICSNPDCPFMKEICSNPKCPFTNEQQVFSEACSNPDCPFKMAKEPSPTRLPPPCNDVVCSNPECPFSVNSMDSECSNPECPFKNKGIPKEKSSSGDCKCNNPECPDKRCSSPECPFNIRAQEICTNPECPNKGILAGGKKKRVCGNIYKDRSICGDDTCPYQEEKDKKEPEEEKEAKDEKPVENAAEGVIEKKSGFRPSVYDMAPCTLQTCRFLGGKIRCAECAQQTGGKRRGPCPKRCPGDARCPLAVQANTNNQNVNNKTTDRRIKAQNQLSILNITKKDLKKAKKQYVYHLGDTYPGRHFGHQDCVTNHPMVPAKMGWLWNLDVPVLNMKRRKGWRPGAINKVILEQIQAHRRALSLPPLELRTRRKKRFGEESDDAELINPKPTLEVKKRDGVYYITMNPLKDPATLVTNENPYMSVTPIQFKIKKNKPTNDYKTCVCNDHGILTEDETSSSESELDIELTPPAGLIRPERFRRVHNVIHIETQYNPKDFEDEEKKGGKKVDKKGDKKSRDKSKDRGRGKEKGKDKKGGSDKGKDKSKERPGSAKKDDGKKKVKK